MGGEHQIHHQNAHAKDHHGQSTGFNFFPGNAGPVKAEALEILSGEHVLDASNGLARALAWSWRSLNLDRAEQVEAVDDAGTNRLLHREEFRQRDLLSRGVLDVNRAQLVLG